MVLEINSNAGCNKAHTWGIQPESNIIITWSKNHKLKLNINFGVYVNVLTVVFKKSKHIQRGFFLY